MPPFLVKIRGGAEPPPRPSMRHVAWSWLGALVTIAVLARLSVASGYELLMAPFGASCVLAFGLPDSPLSQPRSIIGGHLVASLVGLLVLHLFGSGPWMMALAVACAIAAMQLTRTVHAPAGADPLAVMLAQAGWDFLLFPAAAGAAGIVLVALVINNLAPGRTYPRYWL